MQNQSSKTTNTDTCTQYREERRKKRGTEEGGGGVRERCVRGAETHMHAYTNTNTRKHTNTQKGSGTSRGFGEKHRCNCRGSRGGSSVSGDKRREEEEEVEVEEVKKQINNQGVKHTSTNELPSKQTKHTNNDSNNARANRNQRDAQGRFAVGLPGCAAFSARSSCGGGGQGFDGSR